MCLVFVAWRTHPRYRLVVAANRDEYHARPSALAAPWETERPARGPAGDDPTERREPESFTGADASAGVPGPCGGDVPGRTILAGRDLLAGGTWFGVSPDGRFAALTNVSGSAPPAPDAPSRGRLAVDFLQSRLDARSHAHRVAHEARRYSGFNLLLGDRGGLFCVTNRGDERITELPPGCHGLGNDRLNASEPKVTGGLAEFARVLGTRFVADDLFALLADDEPAADSGPGGVSPTSMVERARSARFIRSGVYGTRSSTVLRIDPAGAIEFEERSFDPRAAETGRVAFASPGGDPAGFAPVRTPSGDRAAAD